MSGSSVILAQSQIVLLTTRSLWLEQLSLMETGDCDSESRPDIGHSQPGESNKAGHRDSADQDKVTEGGSDSSSPFYEGVTGQRLPKKGEVRYSDSLRVCILICIVCRLSC